jgi:hypothetical protein
VAAGLLTSQGHDVLAAWTISVQDQVVTSRAIDVSECRPPAAAPDVGETTPRPPRVRVSSAVGGPSWIVASTSTAGVACRVDSTSAGSGAAPVARPVTLPTGCVPVAVQAHLPEAGPATLLCADAFGVTTYRQG